MSTHPEWNREALLGNSFLAPLHALISCMTTDAFPALEELNALLASHRPAIVVQSGMPLQFVPQQFGKLPFEVQYEPRCYLKGEVPTRTSNWHDLFNALVWLAFPKSKAAINARHYHALMDRRKVANADKIGKRGAVRDTGTLLDESGVIVVSADIELTTLLRDFQWKELFWSRRAQVRSSMGFYLFGHGLYEKTLRPYLGITGQGLLLKVEPEFFTWKMGRRLAHLDDLLSHYLSSPDHCMSTRELTPVPLLGVPGWAPENEHAAYYDNREYFRPGRHERSSS